MEIERKYLIDTLPENLDTYPHKKIEQGYLCTSPVVRIRKQDEEYFLTYKSKGLMSREEYNLPLDEESFLHLIGKADGNVISKRRYQIPYSCNGKSFLIELDVFEKPFAPLVLAEVEFLSEEQSENFIPPEWFDKEVTYDPNYHNSNMSKRSFS